MDDYTNAEWLAALRSAEPDAALDVLRARLARGLRYALHDLMPTPNYADDALAVLTAPEPLPEQQAAQRQIAELLHHLIAHALTARQRQALNAVMMRGMPIEEVARRMDTNRNALYKLLYDARARLKRELHARGFTATELLAAFGRD